MFVDLVEFTKTSAILTRERFDELLNMFETLPAPIFEKYGGNIVKKIGDAFLVTFKSPTDAVLCGIALQNVFRRYNIRSRLRHPLRIRVAIHSGEVMHRGGDIYGDAVNTASRIEGIAEAGQVVFSEAVFSAMNKNEIPCIPLGYGKLKGVRYPVRLFRVWTKRDEVLRRQAAFKRLMHQLVALAIVVILLALLLRYIWFNTDLLWPLFTGTPPYAVLENISVG
jgi:class 3 adenylate cyclase